MSKPVGPDPSNSPQTNLGPWDAYKRLLGYVLQHGMVFTVSLVGFVLFAATQPAFASLMEYMVDSVEAADGVARTVIPVAVLGIFLVRGTGFFLGNYGKKPHVRHIVFKYSVEVCCC